MDPESKYHLLSELKPHQQLRSKRRIGIEESLRFIMCPSDNDCRLQLTWRCAATGTDHHFKSSADRGSSGQCLGMPTNLAINSSGKLFKSTDRLRSHPYPQAGQLGVFHLTYSTASSAMETSTSFFSSVLHHFGARDCFDHFLCDELVGSPCRVHTSILHFHRFSSHL